MTLPDVFSVLELDRGSRQILIVEDHVPFLVRLGDRLREDGHVVMSMLGVTEIEGGIVRGPGLVEGESVAIELASIEVAFLDHYFLSRIYNGVSLTEALCRTGPIRIFGMSSDVGKNQAMRQVGAIGAMRKAEFMRLLG